MQTTDRANYTLLATRVSGDVYDVIDWTDRSADRVSGTRLADLSESTGRSVHVDNRYRGEGEPTSFVIRPGQTLADAREASM